MSYRLKELKEEEEEEECFVSFRFWHSDKKSNENINNDNKIE